MGERERPDETVIVELNRTLRGWFGNFKQLDDGMGPISSDRRRHPRGDGADHGRVPVNLRYSAAFGPPSVGPLFDMPWRAD